MSEASAIGKLFESSRDLTDQQFELFRALIQRETGISLRESKRALVVARVAKRLHALGLDSYSGYYDLVANQDPTHEELRRLVNCITTNKTSFFREPHHFHFLRSTLIPKLQAEAAKTGVRQIRIWSAGCSTGEEPYSIAVTLKDCLGTSWPGWDVRILASDIDTDVLATAERAIYPEEGTEGVPPELMPALFMRGVGRWHGFFQVRPELRQVVAFRRINFVDSTWPVRSQFDAVFCRNVIIYFDRPTQSTIVSRLAGYVKPGGYLFAGHSENLYFLGDLLQPLRNTIYRVRGGEHGAHPR